MSLKQYLAEAEARQHIPQAGDVFAIELDDGTLLETYIMSINSDSIVLDTTPKMISVLREWADLDGEAGDVLFEGQFKQSMHDAAERMELDDFVERFGHLFSPGEAREFWMLANDVEDDSKLDETDYQTEIDIVDRGEYDQEGDMAKDDLATIIRAARKLTGMLDDNENMPEWVQSKINKAADYVDTAADYIESNKQRAHDEQNIAEAAVNPMKDAVKVSKGVWRIVDLGGASDDAYEWLDNWDGPIGDAWRDYFGSNVSDQIEFHEYLAQNVDPQALAQYAADVNGWINDAKFDLSEGEMSEAKYQGREVKLGKPTRGDVKKFKVYVRDPATGNIKKVNFGHGGTSAKRLGQKTMKIKKSDPARRRSFRARHNCDNPGPRTKARYWSCRAW